ncbi:MAG: 30S ribosomal protein S13 [Actinobacteria bacterium]|nr:30S ribosomal protein S13 [Actinomycetota bacterium]
MQNLFFKIDDARLIRKKRAEIKRNLKKGMLTVQELFSKGNDYQKFINNMRLYEIIISLPDFGKVRTEKLMKKLNINFCKRLRGLGKNQKGKFYQYFNVGS